MGFTGRVDLYPVTEHMEKPAPVGIWLLRVGECGQRCLQMAAARPWTAEGGG